MLCRLLRVTPTALAAASARAGAIEGVFVVTRMVGEIGAGCSRGSNHLGK